MQATVVSTETLSPSDGVQMWRDVVCRSLVALDVKPADPGRFFGRIAAGELGRLTMTDITSRPQDAHRTQRLISYDQQRYLKIGLLVEGRCVMAQHGREARLDSGDLVCYETGAPYAFHMETPFRLGVFMIPAAGAEHRLRGFEKATAIPVPGDRGLGGVISNALRSVLAGADADANTSASIAGMHIGEAVTDLAAALVAELAGLTPDENAVRTALMGHIRTFIERNLTDPDLSPATVAAGVNISVRYLYKLFEQDGMTVSEWIRNRRLDNTLRDLADPRLTHRTIAGIGARWGFRDPTHLSRVFRTREGISPREFRERAFRNRQDGASWPR
jgi:AraC-like DNA-binding protein